MELNNILSTILIALPLPFLLFLFIIFFKSLTTSNSTNDYSHIPGPKTLPLIGNLHQMLRAATPHRMFKDLATEHGPLMHLQLGELHFLVISSLDLAKQVMKTHDLIFANRPPALVPEAMTYNYADVVFAPYGDHWRELKKICTLELLSARRVRTFRRVREEEFMSLCKSIASSQGSPANLSEMLHLSTYDVISRAVVGARTKDRVTVTSIFDQISKLGSGFLIADLYPSVKLLPLITGVRFKVGRMHRKMDLLFDSIIEQHRSASAKDDDDDDDDNSKIEDFLDVLLKIQRDGTQMPITTQNIKAVLMDMLIAGSDTSTTAVEWAMSEMIRNPNVLKKAKEEVRNVFDDKGFIDEEMFDKLNYLKLIIKETLRLHPATPLLVPRMNTERCELNGYQIPPKSRVLINAWALGRNPEYWNEADKFIPERFDKSSIDFKGNNLEYIPFGAGRRICPGMSFGLANVEFPLAMLLYYFDWEMPNGIKNEELDMTEAFGATVGRKHHLHLIPIVKRPLRAAVS